MKALFVTASICMLLGMTLTMTPKVTAALDKFDRSDDVMLCVQMAKWIPYEELNEKLDGELSRETDPHHAEVDFVFN